MSDPATCPHIVQGEEGTAYCDLAESGVLPLGRVMSDQVEALTALLREIHKPMDQEAEVWSDGPGEETHDERFPGCEAVTMLDDARCEGHGVTMQVCQECGYEHEDGMPVYRGWPCPTIQAVDDFGGRQP